MGSGEQEQVNKSWGMRADKQEQLNGSGEWEQMNKSGQTRLGKCE